MRQRHLTQMKRQTTSTTPLIRSWKGKHITPLRWGTLMRKLEDNQIHHQGRQDASAWASEMKEETNHCLILYRHLTCSSWLVLQNASTRQKTLPWTEEEEEALLYFIIISNLEFTHYPIQPLSFSFPNFMAAHGVGVAQAKPACKHTIATRKCYQYNTNSNKFN